MSIRVPSWTNVGVEQQGMYKNPKQEMISVGIESSFVGTVV